MNLAEMVLKLVAALLMGAVIGAERERQDRPAGLRTHMLVCVGSTLITLVSTGMAAGTSDPTRIAAQIVSGIGFLGAGTIFRFGSAVRGLTTAAGLWTVAGIGMGIGAGGNLLVVSLITGLLVFALNFWLRTFEDRLIRLYHDLTLSMARDGDLLAKVVEKLDSLGVRVERVEWLRENSSSTEASVSLRLRLSSPETRAAVTTWLSGQPGVRHLEWT